MRGVAARRHAGYHLAMAKLTGVVAVLASFVAGCAAEGVVGEVPGDEALRVSADMPAEYVDAVSEAATQWCAVAGACRALTVVDAAPDVTLGGHPDRPCGGPLDRRGTADIARGRIHLCPGLTEVQIRAVALHELGHILGHRVDHLGDGHVMGAYVDRSWGYLTDADVDYVRVGGAETHQQ